MNGRDELKVAIGGRTGLPRPLTDPELMEIVARVRDLQKKREPTEYDWVVIALQVTGHHGELYPDKTQSAVSLNELLEGLWT